MPPALRSLARPSQQLRCLAGGAANPAFPEALQRWLCGQVLAVLVDASDLPLAERFNDLGRCLPYLHPDSLIAGRHLTPLILAGSQFESRWRLCQVAYRLRQKCDELDEHSLEAMVDAVLGSEWPPAMRKRGEILTLLRRLQEDPPKYLCVVGPSAGNLCLFCQVAAPNARILSIDLDHGPDQEAAYSLLSRPGQQITCLQGDSTAPETLAALREWLGGSKLDFLFLDSDHSLGGLTSDFCGYSPAVRVDGIIGLPGILPGPSMRPGADAEARAEERSCFWLELQVAYPDTIELTEPSGPEGFGIGLLRWQGGERPTGDASGATRVPEKNHALALNGQGQACPAGPVLHAAPQKQDEGLRPADDVRLIPFYLPQFHPTPDNDSWWGRGFTEWTNVTRAKPLFHGHYQPHLPADLGFYDLRLPEVRQAQADLAKEYGLHGFCYYHYWLGGAQLLDRPFNEVLRSGEPDFPFCLCWANESWTRAWDCKPDNVIKPQRYSEEDDLDHIRWLIRAFCDERYIRVNDKPLFLVYRAHDLPNPSRTAAVWREEVRKAGFEDLFLCKVECYDDPRGDPALSGFDAAVEFQPDMSRLSQGMIPLLHTEPWGALRAAGLASKVFGDNGVFYYSDWVEQALRLNPPPYKRFPCVMPGFDNSSRHKAEACIFVNSSPALFARWLRACVQRAAAFPAGERIVFINAWNEWAEGNHLEPDQRFGRGYLEATKQARETSETADRVPGNEAGSTGPVASADLP